MNGATVFRRNGPAWRFERTTRFDALRYVSKNGTSYKIACRLHEGKPFAVCKFVDAKGYIDVSKKVGAERIQFDNGDEYIFGGKPP